MWTGVGFRDNGMIYGKKGGGGLCDPVEVAACGLKQSSK